jgi:hypothetical protein
MSASTSVVAIAYDLPKAISTWLPLLRKQGGIKEELLVEWERDLRVAAALMDADKKMGAFAALRLAVKARTSSSDFVCAGLNIVASGGSIRRDVPESEVRSSPYAKLRPFEVVAFAKVGLIKLEEVNRLRERAGVTVVDLERGDRSSDLSALIAAAQAKAEAEMSSPKAAASSSSVEKSRSRGPRAGAAAAASAGAGPSWVGKMAKD